MMRKISKYIYFILGVVTILLFFFTQGVTWYKIGGDSEAYYIHFQHRIEVAPLYPLFFHILDLIFGNELYLYAASVIQLLLTAICVMAFVRFIGRNFKLEIFSIIIVWLASLIPFYLLLPENPIPHDLMTESITYPLMYVYTVLVLKGLYESKEKYFFYSVAFVELMALVRGQMMFLFAVSTIAYIIYLTNKFRNKIFTKNLLMVIRKICALLALSFLCMIGGKLLTEAYNRVFFDAPAQSFSSHLAVQKALYLADEEDAELFDGEITREIFQKTYAEMKKEKTIYQYSEKNLWLWKHAIGSFGANSWYVQDAIESVLTEHELWSDDKLEQENLKLIYSEKISKVLIKDNWKKYITLFFELIPSAFVSTVLFHKESIYLLIHIATAILYLLAMTLSILIIKLSGQLVKETEYMWIIIANAVINVVSTNIMHMGVQRYQAYTVGMFYVGMFLMTRYLFLRWREHKVVAEQ